MIGNFRTLIASRLFPPEVSAGAFRLGALAKALSRRDNAVTVLTTRPPKHAPAAEDGRGVDVRRWPVLRDGGGNVRGYVQYMSFDVPLIVRLLFSRFDVAVAESPPTTGLVVCGVAALRRKPVIYYAADVWTDGVISMGASRAVVSVMRWMERAVLRRANAIISVSEEVTTRLTVLDAPDDRISTVGNGIDTDVFNPRVHAPEGAGRYFVYTGTMSEWQQPHVFIRALSRISDATGDVRIRFFGQGAVEQELRELAAEIVPGRVEFGGVVDPATSASWIRGSVAALVSIVPGIGYDFARPTKTYAAAAVGTPVLFAGPQTGASLVSDCGLGYAVDFDEEAIAEAMLVLLDEHGSTSERLRPERADWARDHVSLNAVADRVASVVVQVAQTATTKLDDAHRKPASDERPTS